MGCCVSSTSKAAGAENPHFQSHCKQSRTPPTSHPLLEEESVKEMLSETPSVPRKPAISCRENNEPRNIAPLLSNASSIPGGKHHKESFFKKPAMIFNHEELPEDVSEICSTHSESVSTATCFTEKDDEYCANIRQSSPAKLRNRSPSRDSRKERGAGKSQAKKPSPNPPRSGARSNSRGLGPNVQNRDDGESSSRRSRSPASRSDSVGATTGLGRSGAPRRNGKSPGRVSSDVGEKIRKLDQAGNGSNSNRETAENKWPPTSNESLENPLVSLECFIFL